MRSQAEPIDQRTETSKDHRGDARLVHVEASVIATECDESSGFTVVVARNSTNDWTCNWAGTWYCGDLDRTLLDVKEF